MSEAISNSGHLEQDFWESIEEWAVFLWHSARDRKIASIKPTPQKIREGVCKNVTHQMKILLDVGCGSGVIARQMLRSAAPDAEVHGIELNPNFYKSLKRLQALDDRFQFHIGSATELPEMLEGKLVDFIATGLPMSGDFLPAQTKAHIMNNFKIMLSPGGLLVAYQVRRNIEELLHEHFDNVLYEYCGSKKLLGRLLEKIDMQPHNIFTASHPKAHPHDPTIAA